MCLYATNPRISSINAIGQHGTLPSGGFRSGALADAGAGCGVGLGAGCPVGVGAGEPDGAGLGVGEG